MSVKFYPWDLDVNMVVMCEIKNVNSVCSEVSLIEYGNVIGMILHKEITRRRLDSYKKHMRVGLVQPMQIIQIDKNRGYIDLSKRELSHEDVEECKEKYNRAKKINSIINHLVQSEIPKNWTSQNHYENWCWLIYSNYKDAYEGFEKCAQGIPFDQIFLNINQLELIEELKKQIESRFIVHRHKLISKVEVFSTSKRGILETKEALNSGKIDDSVQIRLGDCYYSVIISGRSEEIAQEKLKIVLTKISEKITSGQCKLLAN